MRSLVSIRRGQVFNESFGLAPKAVRIRTACTVHSATQVTSIERRAVVETVGGIIVMRGGMNAPSVINPVKENSQEINPPLPAGVEVVAR